jgi:multimeric flavodoxin WrbA
MFAKELAGYGVHVQIRYMADYEIAQGVEFDTGEPGDEARVLYHDVHKSDIIVLATPIWWGIQSSLAQKFMERVGAYDDQYIVSGKTPLYNKVFGCVITASNDGFQHAQGNMYNFASELGMTIPPEAHVTWGTVMGKITNEETGNQIKNAARNLWLWSKAIKTLDLGNIALNIKPGRVGVLSTDMMARSK